jgi:hypothetical protein
LNNAFCLNAPIVCSTQQKTRSMAGRQFVAESHIISFSAPSCSLSALATALSFGRKPPL